MKYWVPSAMILVVATAAIAQDATTTPAAPPVIVPVIRWSAQLATGQAPVTVRIAFYSVQTEGDALWTETQQVTPDAGGKTSLLIGSATEGGIPASVFANGDARFIGLTVNNGTEQPRALIAPAAYAFKAADAETLGGHPVADFALNQRNATGKTLTNITTISGSNGVLINNTAKSSATGPTVALSLDANYLQTLGNSIYVASVAGANGITATRSGTGVTLSLNDSTLQSLGNSLYAQLTGNNSFAGTNTFSKAVSFAGGQTFPGTATTGTNTFSGAQTFDAGVTISANPGASGDALTVTNTNSSSGTGTQTTALNTGMYAAAGSTTNGTGVYGYAPVYGVYGEGTSSSGYGVYGSGNVGVYGISLSSASGAEGVYARYSGSGAGSALYAVLGTASGETDGHGYNAAAVWADTANTWGQNGGSEAALLATANDNYAAVIANNSPTGYDALYVDAGGLGNGIQVYAGGAQNQAINAVAQGSSGIGVSGESSGASGVGVSGTETMDFAPGMEAENSAKYGVGLYGQVYSASSTGKSQITNQIGVAVWGDVGGSYQSAQYAIPVVGTADDNFAGIFLNNSNTWPTLNLVNAGTAGTAVPIFAAHTIANGCGINGSGDVSCTGRLKTAVDAGSAGKVEVYAVQSPENWFEDFGSGRLFNGKASIAIDLKFAAIVNTGVQYHVFLTPRGDCEGLYVSNLTAKGFEVRELRQGGSSVEFDYRIVAKRNGHENERLTDATAEVAKYTGGLPGGGAGVSGAATRSTPQRPARQGNAPRLPAFHAPAHPMDPVQKAEVFPAEKRQ